MARMSTFAIVLFCTIVFAVPFVQGQTTEFTYQGSLKDGANPANGNYDFEFALFDGLSVGAQIGSTLTRSNVAVANGTFAVNLDFGSQFPGANRFLEIHVRTAGGGAFTSLLPRQSVGSSPYSVQSLNATNATNATTAATAANAAQLGGVAANQYVLTTDPRMTDSRPPAAGSANYIQNTLVQQAASNFNVSGNGTSGGTLSGNIVNATTQYNLGGSRVLAGPGTGNFFAGANTGTVNTGTGNAFFGSNAGAANTSGSANSFFGPSAGASNTVGQSNVFFGNAAGNQNLNGQFNVYVGQFAGGNNIAGQANTFIGTTAGASPTSGSNNVAVGADAGNAPTLGSNNTFLGKGAIPNAPNLNFATAIGSGAVVGTSNTIVLGRSNDNTIVSGTLDVSGTLTIHSSFAGTSTPVCVVNAPGGGQIGICSSSLRYKSNVESYIGGLDVVRRLRPITFNWKEGGLSDVGFAAEEVNTVEPLLTVFNKEGRIEGVKYGQVTTVLVNAVKEQQAQIESQAKQVEAMEKQNQTLKKLIEQQEAANKRQQAEIDALRKLVCSKKKNAAACR